MLGYHDGYPHPSLQVLLKQIWKATSTPPFFAIFATKPRSWNGCKMAQMDYLWQATHASGWCQVSFQSTRTVPGISLLLEGEVITTCSPQLLGLQPLKLRKGLWKITLQANVQIEHVKFIPSEDAFECVRTQVAVTAVPTSLAPFCAPPVLPRLQRRTAAWQRCFTGAFLAGPWNLHFGTAPRPWTKWGAGGRGTWQLKNRNWINFQLRWRQARLALSSRLPTSRTWSDRKIDRTFRTWHWHNLSLLAPVLHLLLSIPGCKLLPFCHLVRHDGSTANPENPKPRPSAPPPSHWAQSAGVVPSRAGTWTCIKLVLTRLELKVSKVRRLRNATPPKRKKRQSLGLQTAHSRSKAPAPETWGWA